MALAVDGHRLARDDRHVLRGRMRVDAEAPRHRLAFNVEEALRLCSLPGEYQGRTYYFRRLRIDGLPEDGDRDAWLGAFQCALAAAAASAVHGAEGAARSADAVFFRSEQEACECLLWLILRRKPVDTWYWPAVSRAPPRASASSQVRALIEKLLATPASWLAVAAMVSSAVRDDDSLAILDLLPDSAIRTWLSDLGAANPARPDEAPLQFFEPMRSAVLRSMSRLGALDPRVLWLASLAVVLARPAELERRRVVSHAQRSLRAMQQGDVSRPPPTLSKSDDRVAPTP